MRMALALMGVAMTLLAVAVLRGLSFGTVLVTLYHLSAAAPDQVREALSGYVLEEVKA
jgi:hypothetical protein